jgi:hypothetical protein
MTAGLEDVMVLASILPAADAIGELNIKKFKSIIATIML